MPAIRSDDSWWPPSYLVSGMRWLVKHPKDADPEGRFRDPVYNKLWTPVWEGTLTDGIRLTGCAGGMIHVDESDLEWALVDVGISGGTRPRLKKHSTLTLINAFEYCLCLAAYEVDGKRIPSGAVSNAHIIKVGGPLVAHDIGRGLLNDAHWMLSSKASGGSAPIPAAALDRATEIFKAISASVYGQAIDLLSFVNRAIGANRERHYDETLILAWSVTEACQSTLWDRYIMEASGKHGFLVGKDRRKKLKGRDFTASVVTENLTLAGHIDDAFRQRMDRVRSARNKWAHELVVPTPATAKEALQVAMSMCSRVIGQNVEDLPL
ncbi:MAG TPA: hypothetical protein VFA63_13465 [Pseudonocardiaceae bacterium]|nr:hypothetical protein [Pseudonocardiaceae bacterium]